MTRKQNDPGFTSVKQFSSPRCIVYLYKVLLVHYFQVQEIVLIVKTHQIRIRILIVVIVEKIFDIFLDN